MCGNNNNNNNNTPSIPTQVTVLHFHIVTNNYSQDGNPSASGKEDSELEQDGSPSASGQED